MDGRVENVERRIVQTRRQPFRRDECFHGRYSRLSGDGNKRQVDRDARLGALYMVLSTIILTAQDAIAKWLTADYHSGEILFYRTISGMAVVFWLMRRDGGWRLAVPRAPKLTILRGVLAVLCSLAIVMSWAVLPLADAMAVVFVSPVILTIMSAILLRERVGRNGWGRPWLSVSSACW